MREIKFRGKTTTGKWVYGYYFYGYADYSYRETKDKKHWIEGYDENNNYYIYEVIPETVGQFTGLHDKNGKEIFEGDIVNITSGIGNFINKKGAVIFTEGAFHIEGQGFTLSFASQYSLEVIGNIHDKEAAL